MKLKIADNIVAEGEAYEVGMCIAFFINTMKILMENRNTEKAVNDEKEFVHMVLEQLFRCDQEDDE